MARRIPLQQINALTDDEDLRQILCLFFLEGGNVEDFSAHMDQVAEVERTDRLIEQYWARTLNEIQSRSNRVLGHFNELDQLILIYLAMGLSVDSISRVIGIPTPYIHCAIRSIQYNPIWTKIIIK